MVNMVTGTGVRGGLLEGDAKGLRTCDQCVLMCVFILCIHTHVSVTGMGQPTWAQ